MVQKNSTNLGREGEKRAKRYLESKGYIIRDCNWRFQKLEIDLVAEKDNTLVFVEVKSRKNEDFGEPELFVNMKKQKHLIRAANAYIEEFQITQEARFDIISINNRQQEVIHIEGAFFPLA